MPKSLSGRIALVTGASRGIGRATAIALAREGAHVVALARTVGGLEELDDEIKKQGSGATLVPLDLRDFDALDRLGASLYERFQKLDVLVGNAGQLGTLSPLSHLDPKTWDEVFAVNVTANWRLIRSLDPLLRAADTGRAVFITSGITYRVRSYWGLYAASKAALEMLTRVYAEETAKTKVRVNLFNPGPIRTRMRTKAMPGEDPMTLDTPEQAAEAILPLCLPSCEASGRIYSYPDKKFLAFNAPA
ncbi:MAG TPA: SDR family NAD(P)-dependent oxidoreductase [Xanthobacteraceae bacterium]|nr:SDR family NAD(P)-dependent oxidoreductase [Xanthobacteraceae bacterium]